MALDPNINTREFLKFCETDSGFHAVRVCIEDAIEGALTPKGLSTELKNTVLNVSTTAIPLPATALTARNFIAIRNLDLTETLYIGNSDVVANDSVGNTAGWQVGPNETYNVDITDAIIIYGVVASGTIKVQIQELA